MKLKTYLTAWGVALTALTACDSDLDGVTYDPATSTPAELKLAGAAQDLYTLDPADASADVFTLEWSQPATAFQAAFTNSLQMDVKGKDFANPETLTQTTEATGTSTYTAKTADLNSKIQNLLAAYELTGLTVELEFRVSSSISATSANLNSNVLTLKVQAYEGEPEYDKFVIMGTYNNWSGTDGNTQYLYCYAQNDNTYQAVVDFKSNASNGFKFADEIPTGDWSNVSYNLGAESDTQTAEAEQMTLKNGGDSKDIKAYSKRFYHFTLTVADLKLVKDAGFDKVVMAGGGDGLSWDANSQEMNFDIAKQKFYLDITLSADTEFKFITADGENVTWWGEKDGAVSSEGDNFKVETAGNYRVWFNLNDWSNPAYELSARDYVGQ